MNAHTHPTRIEIVSLFLGSLLLFTWGLGDTEIISFDSRFYLFAQEMWRHGISFFPTAYGEPYPDYPALSTVLIYITSSLFGHLNKFTAVLPSAIAAALTVTLTYQIGALQNKRWGWYAVLLMMLTVAFLKNARAISLDMYTTLVTAACFYLVYSADIYQQSKRILWLYPLLFLAFAFRGPIGLVIPTGVVCAYYLLDGQIKRLLMVGFSALILLIVCTLSLLVLAYHLGGQPFLQDVLRMEVLGRMGSSSLPPYFYWVDSLASYALSFPLALLTGFGLAYYGLSLRNLSLEKKLLIKLIAWTLVILVGMSIPGDKKIRYVLPMVPAIALLAAYPFVAPTKEKYFVYLRRILLGLFSLFPLVFLLAVLFILPYANHYGVAVTLTYWPLVLALFLLQTAVFFCLYYYANRPPYLTGGVLLIAALSFVITHNGVVEPIERYIDRGRDFVRTIEAQRLAHHARLVFYKERPDSLPIKYLINMPEPTTPLFLYDVESLQHVSTPAYFITSAAYFAALPETVAARFRVIAKESLGHVTVVVFTQR